MFNYIYTFVIFYLKLFINVFISLKFCKFAFNLSFLSILFTANMNFRFFLLLSCLLLLSSCHIKQIPVVNGEDIYYKESVSDAPTRRHDPKYEARVEQQKISASAKTLLNEAYSWVGTPYSYAGHSKNGTDCSGYVMEVYKRALDFYLPRSTTQQSEACNDVDRDDLRIGDLVFFRDLSHGKVSHVGIYVGGGKFLHASSSQGVIESSLKEKYYDRRFRHGGRIKGLKLK